MIITPDPVLVELFLPGPNFVAFVPTPRGTLQLAESHLRTMLSASAELQSWLGVTSAADALSRIHYMALPRRGGAGAYGRSELESARPYVLIYTESFRGDHAATDTFYRYQHSGSFAVILEQTIDADLLDGGLGGRAEDRATMHLEFQNTIGVIIDELETDSGGAGNLAFSAIEMSEPWQRTLDDDVETMGHAMGVRLDVNWEFGQ